MDAAAFATLSDPTRFQLVEALRGGERPVGELVREVGIAQSGVSRHLRLLRDAGFVTSRKDGQRRLYLLKPERFQELDGWLTQYRVLWDARLDRFGEALRDRQLARATARQERTHDR